MVFVRGYKRGDQISMRYTLQFYLVAFADGIKHFYWGIRVWLDMHLMRCEKCGKRGCSGLCCLSLPKTLRGVDG